MSAPGGNHVRGAGTGPATGGGASAAGEGTTVVGTAHAGDPPRSFNVRQAAFMGVGAMVGAGIFALLGAAGEVAGAAVWISFLIAGTIAGLQGYSFAKLGARFPSAGGMLEYVGSKAVAKAQTVIVIVVLSILTLFAVVTLANMDPSLLAFSGYPSVKDIVASVALTFFAFLGFGVITFTAKDLRDPARQLPRAMYLALAIATTIYVAVALGVFGTLTVHEVIESGGTALAVAAQPALGDAGYWLMTVTALFATAGATNSGLYPAAGLCEQMASTGQFPPALGRKLADRAAAGVLVTAALAIVLAAGFDLTSIASIGSAIALIVFGLVSIGHLRIRGQTGARASVLVVAVATTLVVLVTFAVTTLPDEPGTAVALVVILVLSVAFDVAWKRARASRERAVTTASA